MNTDNELRHGSESAPSGYATVLYRFEVRALPVADFDRAKPLSQGSRLRRLLQADLARFAGGSAMTEPLGLLAVALENRPGGGLLPSPAGRFAR